MARRVIRSARRVKMNTVWRSPCPDFLPFEIVERVFMRNSNPSKIGLLFLLAAGFASLVLCGQETSKKNEDVQQSPEPAQLTDDEALAFFEAEVLPVLKQHCFDCHGGGDKVNAGFVLTNREDLVAGGDSGPAIDLESPGQHRTISPYTPMSAQDQYPKRGPAKTSCLTAPSGSIYPRSTAAYGA